MDTKTVNAGGMQAAGDSSSHSHRRPGVQSLRRTLSYYDLVIYGIAYVAPFGLFQSLGFVWQSSNGLIVLAYILAAVCMYFTAKSYALMTEAVPSAGSVYGFARNALGPFTGFVAGWMILLDYLLIPAYVYVVMAVALGTLIPQVDRASWILVLGGATLGINWFGVRVTSRVNLFSVVVQVAVLALLLVLSLVALYHGKGNGGLSLRPLYAPELLRANSIFTATSICVMSFLGFDATGPRCSPPGSWPPSSGSPMPCPCRSALHASCTPWAATASCRWCLPGFIRNTALPMWGCWSPP